MNRPAIIAAGALALVALACSMPSPDEDADGGGDGDVFAGAPAFEAVEFTGEQDGIVELPDGVTQAIVTASHDGEHYFSISSLDEANEATGDMLVNAIGAYTGSTLLGQYAQGEPARLEVTADGAWSITLTPLSDAAALPESGTGDGVYRYDGDAGTWSVVHTGEHYFSLNYYTNADFELSMLATEVGAYDGDVAVTDGPALVVITADGDWTITPQ
jgi:hypothetical protein